MSTPDSARTARRTVIVQPGHACRGGVSVSSAVSTGSARSNANPAHSHPSTSHAWTAGQASPAVSTASCQCRDVTAATASPRSGRMRRAAAATKTSVMPSHNMNRLRSARRGAGGSFAVARAAASRKRSSQ